jgi:hypothetical protein
MLLRLFIEGTFTPAKRSFTETRPFAGTPASAPVSAANAFSARTYAEPEHTPDPVMPEPEKKPEPLYRDPSAGLRRDYNDRPSNKLDIPAFLRK